jgi:hypothetical protein
MSRIAQPDLWQKVAVVVIIGVALVLALVGAAALTWIAVGP